MITITDKLLVSVLYFGPYIKSGAGLVEELHNPHQIP